jgi:diguanylate cyclase (GGDEF)-like protein/putative nucleotidyltransferase with HDIG domain
MTKSVATVREVPGVRAMLVTAVGSAAGILLIFLAEVFKAGSVSNAFVGLEGYSVVISIPILVLTYISYITYKTFFRRVQASSQHIETLTRLYIATIESLAMAIDAKDQTAQGHIRRVRAMCESLARAAGYPADQMEGLKAAALLHDIGKLAIPEQILNKPGRLSEAEYIKVMVHPVVAADILSNVEFPYEVVPIVKHHHEKFDGTGYPSGLKADEIPLGARILTIVDCYDALTHSRPHRAGYSRGQALELMRQETGKTFDPMLLESFFEIASTIEDGCEIAEERLGSFQPLAVTPSDVGSTGQLVEAAGIGQRSLAEKALRDITTAQWEVLSLYEISQTLGSALTLSELLPIIATKLEKIANFTTLVIYLAEAGCLRAVHVSGQNADSIKGTAVGLGEGEVGWAALHRQVLIGAGGQVTGPLQPACGNGSAYQSVAVFPLLRQHSLVGVLAFYSEEARGYTPDEVRLLETISGHAACAVSNALTFQQTQESALTDSLTGLPNSRYMYSFFEQERSRAERHDSPLVLMMMDLDGFKKINDTYGHNVGDEILKRTALIARRHLRLGDTLIRYAGDEFVAILHYATPDVVSDLKQRLQTAVEDFAHEVRPGRVARIGISIGHAALGCDGVAIDELMEVADRRMYEDKLARKPVTVAVGTGARQT